MAQTKSFKGLVEHHVATDPAFAEAFHKEGLGSRDGDEEAARRREREAERGDLARPAIGLAILLLACEMLLASWFGRRRR